jgi:shikimate 5-dehydrogenase
MAIGEPTEATPRQAGARAVRTAAVVIYATLALLILTIPQSLPNWLRDMEENPVQQALLQAASGVQAASQAVGLDIPYRRARAAFHAWTGKEDD